MKAKTYVRKIPAPVKSSSQNSSPQIHWLDMELTERCNNNCIHCSINLAASDHRALTDELPLKEILRIIREAHELGCRLIRFTGGEPLLRSDFVDIYLFARRLGIKILLFTNACLITPELIRVWRGLPPGEKIEVTLYGMTPDSCEAVTRTPGSFKSAWKGIQLLLNNNIPFTVKSVLLPANESEIPRFLDWAKTIPWMQSRPQITAIYDLRSRRDSPSRNRLIRSIRPSPQQCLEFMTTFPADYIAEMKRFLARPVPVADRRLFRCNAGLGGGSVDAYGFLQPCLLVRFPAAGYDLRKGSLKHAFSKFFPELRKKNAENPQYLKRCAVCFLRVLCEQCPGKSWAEHGSLDEPVDYLCRITRIQAEFLGLLAKNEKPWEVQNSRERINEFVKK